MARTAVGNAFHVGHDGDRRAEWPLDIACLAPSRQEGSHCFAGDGIDRGVPQYGCGGTGNGKIFISKVWRLDGRVRATSGFGGAVNPLHQSGCWIITIPLADG